MDKTLNLNKSLLTFRTGFNGCFVAKFGDPRGDEVLIAFIFLNVGNLRSNSKQLHCCCHRTIILPSSKIKLPVFARNDFLIFNPLSNVSKSHT